MYNPYGYSAPLQDNLAAYRSPYNQPPMAQQMPYAGQTAMQNPMQTILQQFQTFRQNYKGDAQAEVQRIISSGQISQEQLNQIQNMASQIMRMLPR